MAFHNLTDKIASEDTKQSFQIAVIPIENPPDVNFFSIGGSKVEVYWTPDSTAFDYFLFPQGKVEIWRQGLDKKTGPQLVRTFLKERIFGLAHSNDGKTFAVSRGQQQYDAVLLTNFEQ